MPGDFDYRLLFDDDFFSTDCVLCLPDGAEAANGYLLPRLWILLMK
jgi:hypothetical protein